jgi:hypothetical protein
MTHEQAIEMLRDIEGMDATWWQALLAWLLFYGGIVVVVGGAGYFIFRFWRDKIRRKNIWSMAGLLEQIKLSSEPPKTRVAAFNDWLRRLAIMQHGRDVAGISGLEWLQWLDENSARAEGFSWVEKGRLLLDLPYAPPSATMDDAAWQHMLFAAEQWLKSTSANSTLASNLLFSRSTFLRAFLPKLVSKYAFKAVESRK